MKYIERIIDKYLLEWKDSSEHKPLLLRGARQVGKSSAVRHLGEKFKHFAEVNFEQLKNIHTFFSGDIDVRLITAKISKYINVPIEPGKTLLFCVIGLGNGGIKLVASACVVALKFIIDFRRCTELFFQAIRSDKR